MIGSGGFISSPNKKKPLKKCRDFGIFSIFKNSVRISSYMDNSMLINGLPPSLFEEEKGNEGVNRLLQITFSKSLLNQNF